MFIKSIKFSSTFKLVDLFPLVNLNKLEINLNKYKTDVTVIV